jgi:signal transduction histidine kinase
MRLSDPIKRAVPIVCLLVLPDVIGTTGWLGHRAWVDLWLRALSYAYPAWVLAIWLIRTKRFYGLAWTPRTVAFSVLYGFLSGWSLMALGAVLMRSADPQELLVRGADLLPGVETLAWIAGAALLSTLVLAVVVVAGWFLFNSEMDRLVLVHSGSVMGVCLAGAIAAISDGRESVSVLGLAVPVAILLHGAAYRGHRVPDRLWSFSPLRAILAGAVFVSGYILAVLWMDSRVYHPAVPDVDFLHSFLRLVYVVIALALAGYAIYWYRSGERIGLLQGRDRFEHLVLDTFILSSLVFLLILTVFSWHFATVDLHRYEGAALETRIGEIHRTMRLNLIVHGSILAMFLGVAVMMGRKWLRPIQQFRTGMTRIATGQFDTLIPVSSRDEIGDLANAYNLMVFRLKDLQDELADKERQTAWAEMARQVAHEIKNPLTPMKLSVQHLDQQVRFGQKSPDEIKEMIARISDTLIREIESLNNIANDFSKFARPIMEEFEETDVNEVIRSILTLYQHDHRLYLWSDLDPRGLKVFAAPDELKRVMLNLVKNALEAIPAGGVVIIRTARFGGSAWIEVIDNGDGIPDALKSRIFIPNFSTKSAGTGLGLAICRKVVKAHKGDIAFSSTPGMGTTFTIRLPLCDMT